MNGSTSGDRASTWDYLDAQSPQRFTSKLEPRPIYDESNGLKACWGSVAHLHCRKIWARYLRTEDLVDPQLILVQIYAGKTCLIMLASLYISLIITLLFDDEYFPPTDY